MKMYLENQNQDYFNDSENENQLDSSTQEINLNETNKSCIKRYNKNNIILYLKTFFVLIIQCLFVILFIWLGFFLGISDAFINSEGAIKSTLIIVSIYILILCYSAFCFGESSKCLYIHVISYIPCMVFYCYLISAVTDKTNIYIVLFSIFLDIFSIFIYLLSFASLNFIGLLLFPLISNIIAVSLISFKFLNNDIELIVKIIAIDVSAIIYFNIVFFVLKGGLDCISCIPTISVEKDEYIFIVVFFDLSIFSPAASVLLLIMVILDEATRRGR